MAISKTIDFSNVKAIKVFHKMTKQYNALTNLNESAWSSYIFEMKKKGVSVSYDALQDAYTAMPINENGMTNNKKYLLQDEDGMDMEQDVMDLINSINLKDEEPTAAPVQTVKPEMPVPAVNPEPTINLSQFEALLNKILGGSKGEIEVPAAQPEQQQIDNGTFLGNPLETEFEANAEQIDNIVGQIESADSSYSGVKGRRNDTVVSNDNSNYCDTQELDPTSDSDVEELPSVSATDEDDIDTLDEYENSEMEYYGKKTGELIKGNYDKHGIKDKDKDEDETYVGADGMTYGSSKPGEVFSEEEELMEDDEFEPVAPTKPITANVTQNLNGTPVQIILTGVIITPQEIQYVAESVKKSGMTFKKLEGKGKVLKIVVENAGRQYTVRYEDNPQTKTRRPFTIKEHSFQTLTEALKRINFDRKTSLKESENFKKLVGKDIIEGRIFSDIKESDILKEFQGKVSKDYIPGWNVKAVGTVNLKNGLNEVYSNLTEHSDESNTLVKTKDGQYFMIKGNLKERSEVGTKRHLIDLEGKKDFGVAQVVGIYENNYKGLGQIMYKIKKTALPLLTWK
jgi:hypothetical protein